MKKKQVGALLLTAMLVLTACGQAGGENAGQNSEESSGSQNEVAVESEENRESSGQTTGGILRVGAQVDDTQLSNLSPFATSGTFSDMLGLIYEPLLLYNPVKGELEPALASGYSWNDNITELTLTMTEGARWQDGEAITAEDAAYTFEVLKNVPTFDKYALWDKLVDVRAEGDAVVFELEEPFTSLPQYLSQVKIVPKHIWEKENVETFTNNEPVGSGAFIYKGYTAGTSITLEANKDYWRGSPILDGMTIVMYNTAPNCMLGLMGGEIDTAISGIAMSSIPEFLTHENAKMLVYGNMGNFCVAINHENELLSDVNVRKAMAMAINQEDLIAKGEYNGVMPTSIAWLPEAFGELVNKEAIDSLHYDLEGAKQILEDAGYTKGNDGIYQKDGKRLSFTYVNASGAPAQQMEAGMIQQWLLNLGIEIIPKLATWPELTELGQTGEFELIQLPITFPPDAYSALNSCFASSMTAPTGEKAPGLNYFRYRNAEMDELLDQASAEVDQEKLKDIYYQIQNILAEDYVYLPMYNNSGHEVYYDGANFTGWQDHEGSIWSPMNLISIRPVD